MTYIQDKKTHEAVMKEYDKMKTKKLIEEVEKEIEDNIGTDTGLRKGFICSECDEKNSFDVICVNCKTEFPIEEVTNQAKLKGILLGAISELRNELEFFWKIEDEIRTKIQQITTEIKEYEQKLEKLE